VTEKTRANTRAKAQAELERRRRKRYGASRPQPQGGPQAAFVESTAFFTLYGGAAGSGKSYGGQLKMFEKLEHDRNFRGLCLRRSMPEITGSGGLWDEGLELIRLTGGRPNQANHTARWKSGARVTYTHLQNEKKLATHQSLQYDGLFFDELTHFPAKFFFYMISRLRSSAGTMEPPQVWGSCNPDPDSFLLWFVQPYLDDDGYPDPDKCDGSLRWFTREGAVLRWVDEDWVGDDGARPWSFLFIPAKLEDNRALVERDPAYGNRLRVLEAVDRERLREGNWLLRGEPGHYTQEKFEIIDMPPPDVHWLRYWDHGGTRKGVKWGGKSADATTGGKVGLSGGRLVIADMRMFWEEGGTKRRLMLNTAKADGIDTVIYLEQEPAASGKELFADYQTEYLAGFEVHSDKPKGDKETRAKRWLPWVDSGRVQVVRGAWNQAFFQEVEAYPRGAWNQIDAVSGGFTMLTAGLTDGELECGAVSDQEIEADIELADIGLGGATDFGDLF
jgi:predicted phage terminase large subunit-like protein|tara:strand:- start:4080 stop:5588 length:1509 start_codon:yes stop_codon:yes gene_type:complete